jgi:signal transduction histidine kinase
MEAGLIVQFNEFLDAFGLAVKHAGDIQTTDAGSRPMTEDARVKEAQQKLAQTADELRGAIYQDMYRRIDIAKAHQSRSMIIVITCSTAAVLLVAGLLYFFYGWVFYPIQRLQEGVRHVAEGKFGQPIHLQSGDELEELAHAFNEMSARVQATYTDLAQQVNERSRQLVRSERLVSVGFLAAGVAHEINNPLASIAFCSEALQRRMQDLYPRIPQDAATVHKYLAMIQSEAFRCKEITQKLLEFSRVGERRREPADLVELVQSVLEVAQLLQNCKGKQIVFQPYQRVTALVNGPDLKSVVLNLVVNALDSMEEGGVLTITLTQRGPHAELVFRDSGCGMEADVLENIFEPFFTRSRTGKGTGLGLFISQRVATQHGGTITASSDGPGRGSTFSVRLPLNSGQGSVAGGQTKDPYPGALPFVPATPARVAA